MTPAAMQRNIAYAQAKADLTKRYIPTCRNEVRVLRSHGKLRHLPSRDEAFAVELASLRAVDALRHGLTDDLIESAPRGDGTAPQTPAVPSFLSQKKVA